MVNVATHVRNIVSFPSYKMYVTEDGAISIMRFMIPKDYRFCEGRSVLDRH
jgi:hypothetical protein